MSEDQTVEGPGVEIDVHEVMRRIPHRPPFLMVDRAERFVPHTSLLGIKCVTINEPFFVGHFPGNPVMPGVLIVEALAQTGGLLMSKSWDVDPEGKIILFMSVDNCRFRAPVRPGDVLRLMVEVQRARGDVVKFRGRALVGEKLAAEAGVALPAPDPRAAEQERERQGLSEWLESAAKWFEAELRRPVSQTTM